MPFINNKTNVPISKAQEISVKEKLGQAISLLPGKSENWLMVGFEPECPLYFRGSDKENSPLKASGRSPRSPTACAT